MNLFSHSGNHHQSHILAKLMIAGLVLMTAYILTSKFYYLAFVPSLGVVAALLLARYPQLGVYALVFLIPFGAFRKFAVAGIEVNISWLIAGPLFILVMARHLLNKTTISAKAIPLWPWLGLFFLVNVISTWLSPYPQSAMHDMKLWLASFFYIALLVMLLTPKDFKTVLPNVLIFSVCLSSLLGNLGFFFNLSLFSRTQTSGAFARNLGGAIDANNMSLMVIACLPLVVYRFIYAKSLWLKWLYLLVLANSVLAVGTTYSRGGFLIFMLAIVLMLVEFHRYLKVRHIGFALLGLSLGLTVFVTLMPSSFWERQSSLGDWQDSSLARRSSYLFVAADAFMARPVFGSGPDSFYHIFAQTHFARLSKEDGRRLGRYAHNTYIEILVGMGALGLLIFLIILAKAMLSFSRAKRHFVEAGLNEQACFIGSCRLFLLLVLIYLAIFSESHHKFMLLGLVMSQLAMQYWQQVSAELLSQQSLQGETVNDG